MNCFFQLQHQIKLFVQKSFQFDVQRFLVQEFVRIISQQILCVNYELNSRQTSIYL